MTVPDVHTLGGAYALDAVPDGERVAFEAHVAQCASCADEVRELRAVAARLGEAVAVAPPPALRQRVLADIDRTRQDAPVSLISVSRAPWRRARGLMAVAAALLLVVAGAAGLRVGQLNNRLDRLQLVSNVLAAPDAVSVPLPGESKAIARLVHAASQSGAVLVASGLPAAPAGHGYQLWFASDGTMAPAGMFEPDSSGRAEYFVRSDLSAADAVGVSVEPVGGSAQPSGDLVLYAKIKA